MEKATTLFNPYTANQTFLGKLQAIEKELTALLNTPEQAALLVCGDGDHLHDAIHYVGEAIYRYEKLEAEIRADYPIDNQITPEATCEKLILAAVEALSQIISRNNSYSNEEF
jgi:phosphoheptose isomerase